MSVSGGLLTLTVLVGTAVAGVRLFAQEGSAADVRRAEAQDSRFDCLQAQLRRAVRPAGAVYVTSTSVLWQQRIVEMATLHSPVTTQPAAASYLVNVVRDPAGGCAGYRLTVTARG